MKKKKTKKISNYPNREVYSLSFKMIKQVLPISSYEDFKKVYGKYLDEPGNFVNVYSNLFGDSFDYYMGGYPRFIQNEPAFIEGDVSSYTTLLSIVDIEDLFIFGDCGVANFLIKTEDLKKLKFSDVIFYWDCG